MALQIGFLRLTGAPLNSVEMISPQVLAHLGVELGVAPPRLASIRALYRRRRTLFEHQNAAKVALGLHDLTDHGERALNGFLRREASDKFLVDELEQAARVWLSDHHYIQLPKRRLRTSASVARRDVDAGLLTLATAAVGMEQTKAWPLALSETMESDKTRLEWLRDGPSSRKTKGLADHIAKIDFLNKLGAGKLDLGLPTGMLKAQARSMLYRKPATLKRMRSERKVLEMACFLRLQLLRLTDIGLGMIDYRIADLCARPGPAPRRRWKTNFADIMCSSCNWRRLPTTRAPLTPPCAVRCAPCWLHSCRTAHTAFQRRLAASGENSAAAGRGASELLGAARR